VIRTRYNEDGQESQKAKRQKVTIREKRPPKPPTHRRWLSRGSIDGTLGEVQKMTLQLMELENRLEEMKIKEDQIRSCLIEKLNEFSPNSQEIVQEKERLITELEEIPEDETSVQEIEPILGSIYLIFDTLTRDQDESGTENMIEEEEETPKVLGHPIDKSLIFDLIQQNQDYQTRMNELLSSYVAERESKLEADHEVDYLLKLNNLLEKK